MSLKLLWLGCIFSEAIHLHPAIADDFCVMWRRWFPLMQLTGYMKMTVWISLGVYLFFFVCLSILKVYIPAADI